MGIEKRIVFGRFGEIGEQGFGFIREQGLRKRGEGTGATQVAVGGFGALPVTHKTASPMLCANSGFNGSRVKTFLQSAEVVNRLNRIVTVAVRSSQKHLKIDKHFFYLSTIFHRRLLYLHWRCSSRAKTIHRLD